MIENKRVKNWVCCLIVLGLMACESPISSEAPISNPSDDFGTEEPADPLDGFNRAMMELNFFLDDYLLQPAAIAYKALTPEFFQSGVGNFTQYVKLPFYMVNDILQWKIDHFSQNFWIMTVNTFTGVGFINGAGYFDVYAKPNDFGITLHTWGAGSGFNVALPFLGPTCFRDFVGSVVGLIIDPVSIVTNYHEYRWSNFSVTGLGYVHSRSGYIGQLESLRKESYDPYVTIKSIVEQKRASELKENE